MEKFRAGLPPQRFFIFHTNTVSIEKSGELYLQFYAICMKPQIAFCYYVYLFRILFTKHSIVCELSNSRQKSFLKNETLKSGSGYILRYH